MARLCCGPCTAMGMTLPPLLAKLPSSSTRSSRTRQAHDVKHLKALNRRIPFAYFGTGLM
eukprot:scaffold651599_cov45-Prasinocladus_malaysianus.AAC.1